MAGVEFSGLGRPGVSAFPARWGIPPGEPNSLERRMWIKQRCWDEEIRRLHRLDGAVAVELCEALRPQLDGHEAREQVRRLRRGP